MDKIRKQDEVNTKYSKIFTNKQRFPSKEEFATSMNSRLTFAILVSSYLSVLLVSYLLGFFYPFFTPYGWLLVPLVASFFVGYLTREVETATKIIIACLSLHTGIIFALLNFSSVEKAFIAVPTFVSYWIFHIVLGVLMSFAGITLSDYTSYIIAMSVCIVKKIKQITERLLGTVRR
ncbi:MAG: hypothetical protein JSV29_07105 [Candidatus Bathyarchaeota archaeon]|nr:MAG: hypothetical protein JSV29_07105 [Candidatus Bathyarchaeota archaeon]